MRYACLIYFDPQQVFGSPEGEVVLGEVPAHDDGLRESGKLVEGIPLQLPRTAMTVRVRDGKVSATDGPFVETKEMLGGLLVVEARDLDEAVQLAGRIPFARLGAVEVRPLVDYGQPRPRP